MDKMNFITKILKEANEPNNLSDFADEIESLITKYESIGCEISINFRKFSSIYLNTLKVANKTEGIGTKFMLELTKLADEYGITITVSPSDSYGSNLNRLIKFYKRFGFVSNSGRYRNDALTGTLIRIPK